MEGARHAATLVQSFCLVSTSHADFAAFAEAVGFGDVAAGAISAARGVGVVALRLGWAAD